MLRRLDPIRRARHQRRRPPPPTRRRLPRGARLDRDLRPEDITRRTSVDALAAFLHNLGYPTHLRTALTPDGVGLASGPAIRQMEMLSEDADGFLQVILVQLPREC